MTDEMDGLCSLIVESKTVHQIVVGSPAAKSDLGDVGIDGLIILNFVHLRKG